MNLIPAPRREAAAARAHLVRWAAGLAVYCVLLLAASIACSVYAGGDASALTEESRRLSARLAGPNQMVLALQRELAGAQRRLRSAQEVGKQPDWSVVMALLANIVADDLVLDMCRLDRVLRTGDQPGKRGSASGRRFVLTLSGLARSQAAVSSFILRLEKTGLFTRVGLVKTSRQSFLSGKAVAFEVKCLLEEGGSGQP